MRKIVLILVMLVFGKMSLSAKETKPILLVYGSGIEAFAAAMQGAKSDVPTVWISDTQQIVPELTQQPLSIMSNQGLDSGIWMDLLMAAGAHKGVSDSLARVIKHGTAPTAMLKAIETSLTAEKQLTIVRSAKIRSLVRNKKDWTVLLDNGMKYEVRAVVDASENGELLQKVEGGTLVPGHAIQTKTATLTAEQIRTTVAIGEYKGTAFTITVKDILSQNHQELFVVPSVLSVQKDAESIPLRAHIGQAIGALAGYCAFFKTSGDKVDVRKLQAELLAFGIRLLPWKDVLTADPHYAAVQRCYLATVLKGRQENQMFEKGDSVTVENVKPIFNQLYSRSQLWFADNKPEYFSLKDLLSLIKFVSFRGDEVDAEVEKDWTKRLKFTGEYNPDRTVTRDEFVILVNKYANPYVKAVSIEGDILR